jgi:uncharacterized protein (DUF1697 family)
VPTTRYVALLRAVNLGPTRRVPMARLREVLDARGHGPVRTLLASGNVVLDSALTEAELAQDISAAIQEEFALDVPVVVRSGEEMAAVLAGDPFAAVATDLSRYSVTFFAEPLDRARVDALPPAEEGDYLVSGRELYLWLPAGLVESPMGGWKWDRLLGAAGTNRNWNTVTKLAALCTAPR